MDKKQLFAFIGAGLLLLSLVLPMITVMDESFGVFGLRLAIGATALITGILLLICVIIAVLFGVGFMEHKQFIWAALLSTILTLFLYLQVDMKMANVKNAFKQQEMIMERLPMELMDDLQPEMRALINTSLNINEDRAPSFDARFRFGWFVLVLAVLSLWAAIFTRDTWVGGAPPTVDPSYNPALRYWHDQAQEALDNEELDKAIQAYTRLIDLDPENAQHYCNRGIIYKIQGDVDLARADLAEAAQRGNAEARNLLETV